MARRISRQSSEQKLMKVWWVRLIIAVVFTGLAYGFASLAIDSGSLLYYVVSILFLWWAVSHAVRAVRYVFAH